MNEVKINNDGMCVYYFAKTKRSTGIAVIFYSLLLGLSAGFILLLLPKFSDAGTVLFCVSVILCLALSKYLLWNMIKTINLWRSSHLPFMLLKLSFNFFANSWNQSLTKKKRLNISLRLIKIIFIR